MNLKIAMPVVDGRLVQHFGETKHFALVQANRQSRAIGDSQTAAAPPHEPGSFTRWLRAQGVDVLIVGRNGIGQRAFANLVHHGIEVRTGRSGERVAALVAEYLQSRLPPTRHGCDHQNGQARQPHDCRLHLEFETTGEPPPGLNLGADTRAAGPAPGANITGPSGAVSWR